ncbi:MAG: DUF4442 domain-containing protein [Candidatus Alcyoniella australis]|nr:DUF4442 domain-containing protein [Candidatus Alcyoniella australis]
MKEQLLALAAKTAINHYPPYRGSGARVRQISPDFRLVVVELPLNFRTRNLVGTTFGGSMYTAVDPIYMIMFKKVLGEDYVVWDKAASIKFLRPGKTTLTARFVILQQELEQIKQLIEDGKPIQRTYRIELRDASGTSCAEVEKLLYFNKQDPQRKQRIRSLFSRLF